MDWTLTLMVLIAASMLAAILALVAAWSPLVGAILIALALTGATRFPTD